MTMGDTEVVNVTKSQRRNRRRRQKKNKNAISKEVETGKVSKDPVEKTEPNADSTVTKKKSKRGKRGGKRRSRGLDIYYGRFRCRLCNRHWDSARVFTIGGTMRVLYRQRCKLCTGDDAWFFPFRLEIIRCSQCLQTPCECKCEQCGHLIHKRFIEEKVREDDGSGHTKTEKIVDQNFQYCSCEKQRKDKKLGDKIDPKKAHLSALCEKCLKGWPCNRAQEEADNQDSVDDQDGVDNEP